MEVVSATRNTPARSEANTSGPAPAARDIRSGTPYLLARSTLKALGRRAASTVALIAIDVGGLTAALYAALALREAYRGDAARMGVALDPGGRVAALSGARDRARLLAGWALSPTREAQRLRPAPRVARPRRAAHARVRDRDGFRVPHVWSRPDDHRSQRALHRLAEGGLRRRDEGGSAPDRGTAARASRGNRAQRRPCPACARLVPGWDPVRVHRRCLAVASEPRHSPPRAPSRPAARSRDAPGRRAHRRGRRDRPGKASRGRRCGSPSRCSRPHRSEDDGSDRLAGGVHTRAGHAAVRASSAGSRCRRLGSEADLRRRREPRDHNPGASALARRRGGGEADVARTGAVPATAGSVWTSESSSCSSSGRWRMGLPRAGTSWLA